MSKPNFKLILIFVALVFLVVPSGFVLAETMQDYIDYMNNGKEAAAVGSWNTGALSNFDARLMDGDMYRNTHPNDPSIAAYETARRSYLRARQLAIMGERYTPDTSSPTTQYANNAYVALSGETTIDHNNDQITQIDQQLANPNLTPEQRRALEEAKQRLLGQNNNIQNNNNLANTTNKGIIQDKKRAEAEESAACFTWTGGLHPLNCILQVVASIGTLITGVFGSVLWLAGHIFDLSVWFSISTINGWLKDNIGIASAWRVMRDIANICFIFILLYIALGTVFEMQGMGIGNTQKLVVNVMVIALLVNFSGFFTRIIIDSSNIIAYEFYSKMNGPGWSGNPDSQGASFAGIGWRFVEKLDLTRYYVDTSGDSIDNPQINRLSFFGIIIQTFGNVLLILACTFVLLTASILFVIRTIYLIFLYIFSPIAFVSKVIPSNKFNYFQGWLDKLINQSLFAPGFLIPLYIVFAILGDGIGTLAGANGNSALGMLGGGSFVIILMDIVIMGLLLGCIFVAKQMGAAGTKVAMAAAGAATLVGAKQATKFIRSAPAAIRGANQSAGTWARGVAWRDAAERAGAANSPVALTPEERERLGLLGRRPNIASRLTATGVNWAQRAGSAASATASAVSSRATSPISAAATRLTQEARGVVWRDTVESMGQAGRMTAAEQQAALGGAAPTGQRPNIAVRAAASTLLGAQRVAANAPATARAAWESEVGKNIRKSAVGKSVKDFVENPLLAASDWVAKAAAESPLGSVAILGSTAAERADQKKKEKEAEKEEKEKKEKEKKDEIKAKETQLRTASYDEAEDILGTMTDSDIKELAIDVLARDEVCENLTHSNLDALQKAGKIPTSQRRAMATAITRDMRNPGYGYMVGPNGLFWS